MNSELLYITRKLGYPSSFGTRAGLGDFLEQYPDGVYAENGGGAPIGWESAAVWFGGDSERAAARFERMMSERNELSRLFRTRVSGVLVLTFIYRMKSRMVTAIPIVGGQPQPVIDPTWLYFTLPEGGTVSLTKNGTPTAVTLEYSLDNGNTWTEWVESENVRSLTLAAGQTMHVRNTSETSTEFSTSVNNYYNFAFTDDTYAGGNTNSLLCKNPENAVIARYCYYDLFLGCRYLLTAPQLPLTTIAPGCYRGMFQNCIELRTAPELPALVMEADAYVNMFYQCKKLKVAPELPATTLASFCYRSMFYLCTSLEIAPKLHNIVLSPSCYRSMFYACILIDTIYTDMTDISASNCLDSWLTNVSPTGDFYCPSELTIPEGASGIPSGWTRHDI